MDRLAARIPHPPAALATLAVVLGALLVLAGCGSSGGTTTTPAQQLRQPGSAWASMSTDDQRDLLHSCRLSAAVAVATGGSQPAPVASVPSTAAARSAAFNDVLQLPTVDVRAALDARFAGSARPDEPLGEACQQVIQEQIAQAHIGQSPWADFGAPLEATAEGLRLTVDGGGATIPVRLTPATGAILRITSAPARAANPAQVSVAQQGDRAIVRLTHLPVGTSYLRATVRAGGTTWHRLITITGHPASPLPPPRTFAPMVLKGEDTRGFPMIYVPRDAVATVTIDGSPLTLTAARTILLAHPLGGGPQRTFLPAGRYRHVRIRARGEWSIRIVPAR